MVHTSGPSVRSAWPSAVVRGIGLGARAVSWVVLWAALVAAAVVVHHRLPGARRAVVRVANEGLAPLFEGTLIVEDFARVTAVGIEGLRARLTVDGETVATVCDGSGSLDASALLDGLRNGTGLVLRFPHLTVGEASLIAAQDADGAWNLARAFRPKEPPAPPAADSSSGPPLTLAFHTIKLHHAHIEVRTGSPSDAHAPITVDADDVAARATLSGAELAATLERAHLRAAGLPTPWHRTSLRARAAVRMTLDGASPVPAHGSAVVDAQLDDGPLHAEAEIDDGKVHVSLSAGPVSPERGREWFGVGLLQPVAVRVDGAGTFDELSARATVAVGPHEIRAKVRGRLDATGPAPTFRPVGPLEAELETDGLDLARVAADLPRGVFAVKASGKVDLEGRSGDGTVTARVSNFAHGNVALKSASLHATARGPLNDLAVDMRAVVDAGTDRPPPVGGAPISVSAASRVDVARGIESGVWHAQSPHVSVARDVRALAAGASHVTVSSSNVDVPDAKVEGLGAPLAARISLVSGVGTAQVRAPRLDVDRLLSFVPVALPVRGGHLRIDGKVVTKMNPHAVTGRVAAEARGVEVLPASLLASSPRSGRSLTRRIDAELEASLDTRGRFESHGSISSAPLGALRWQTTDVRLAEGRTLADRIARATGKTTLGVRITVDEARSLARALGIDHAAVPPWPSDARIDADLTQSTRGVTATVRAAIVDGTGPLVLAEASAELSAAEARAAPRWSLSDALDLPTHVRITVPKRSLDKLPWPKGVDPPRGTIALAARWDGSLRSPSAEAALDGTLEPGPHLPLPAPTQLAVRATYNGTQALVRGEAHANRTEVAFDARSAGSLRSAVLAAVGRAADKTPWPTDLTTRWSSVPVGVATQGRSSGPSGTLSGSMVVRNWGADARMEGSVDLTPDAKLRGVPPAHATVSYDGTHVRIDASAAPPGGNLRASLSSPLRWGAAAVPDFARLHNARGTFVAAAFPLGSLDTLLPPAIRRLQGRLDANLGLSLSASARASGVTGTVRLRDVELEAAALGESLKQGTLELRVAPDGRWTLTSLRARLGDSTVEGTGAGNLDGVLPKSGGASLRVGEDNPLPVYLEGQKLGAVSARLDVTAAMTADGKLLRVTANVPQLRLKVDDTSIQDIQSLDDAPHVFIGTVDESGAFLPQGATAAAGSGDALPLVLSVRLGRDVRVEQGQMVRTRLEGGVDLQLGDQTTLDGTISVVEGSLNVQGKPFVVERGVLTFREDPSNPLVVLTASWTTPDRSRKILAEFIGPLKSGTFTLRSEPKLSQSQILSLLLFGTPSGLDGSPANRNRQAQASSSAAAGIGAALAAGPLNNALSSAVRADIQATVDTTRSNPRPGVKVGISKDVSAQMSFVWGTPPPGQPPDRYYVALDWRLVRNWFLKASVGDRGATATDVMWQHKY